MEEVAETRFRHFLQPIRDLAENWDIDIASELAEYLNELETISFTFAEVGQSKTLNFAEAALLIQGSACVYSKKVEYLYQLVFQTLDLLKRKKTEQQTISSSIGPDGIDKDVAAEEEPEFLVLDDIEEANGIDLVESEYQIEADPNTPLNFSTNSLSLLISKHTRASESTHEDNIDGGKRSDFKMNTCSLHSSGALLLEDRDRLLLKVLPSDTNNVMRSNLTNISANHPDQNNIDLSHYDAPMNNNSDDDEDLVDQPNFGIFTNEEQQEQNSHEARSVENVAMVRQPKRSKKKVREEEQWEILDPHNDAPPKLFSIRPFKQGKTFERARAKPKSKFRDANQGFDSFKCDIKGSYFEEFKYILDQVKIFSMRAAPRKGHSLPAPTTGPLTVVTPATEVEDENAIANWDTLSDDEDGFVPSLPLEDPDNMEDHLIESSAQSFEQICKSHVDHYLASVEQFVQQTSLSQRISEWRSRIIPILEEEETRPVFDIQKYGQSILKSCPDKKTTSFQDILSSEEMKAAQPYEVCRYFLALLQLTNHMNVSISTEASMNSLKVSLITRQPKIDITNCQIPSLSESSTENVHPKKKVSKPTMHDPNSNKENVNLYNQQIQTL